MTRFLLLSVSVALAGVAVSVALIVTALLTPPLLSLALLVKRDSPYGGMPGQLSSGSASRRQLRARVRREQARTR
eukprot:scaffold1517_cov397-Prasinococcus_capsulatus_cf.AAC.10